LKVKESLSSDNKDSEVSRLSNASSSNKEEDLADKKQPPVPSVVSTKTATPKAKTTGSSKLKKKGKAEDNGPFTVYDLGQTLECIEEGNEKGRLFYGHAVVIKMDLRFVVDDTSKQMYRARISSSNEIIVTSPAYDYNLLYNWDVFHNNQNPKLDPLWLDGMDDATDNYQQHVAGRELRHYKLTFPVDCKLSAKTIFSGAGADEWLELKKIAEQSAQAREARSKRSRAGDNTTTKESTQKLTAKKAAKI
jgi:hypothetical protein